MRPCSNIGRQCAVCVLIAALVLLSACRARPTHGTPTPVLQPTVTPTGLPTTSPAAAPPLAAPTSSRSLGASSRPLGSISAGSQETLAGAVAVLPPLPNAFRFEARMRPVGQAHAAETVVTGQYRDGAWQQIAQMGSSLAQETILVDGVTYTRPAGEDTWTRWEGVSFDAAYGPASPFTVLRLLRLVTRLTGRELDPLPGSGEATWRYRVTVPAATITALLNAGITALTSDIELRASLAAQVQPMAVEQVITYWIGASEQVYQAEANLASTDESGQTAPWVHITWRFWDYEGADVAIAAPPASVDHSTASAAVESTPGAEPVAAVPTTGAVPLGANDNLLVRVNSAPGVAAGELAVTVYPADDEESPAAWSNAATAAFNLPPGRYHVLVQVNYAEDWLRDVQIMAGEAIEREVTFDFGTLELNVEQDHQKADVDIVTYPVGDRENWVDWRSDNPTSIQLRAGGYDVEIAIADDAEVYRLDGIEIRAGQVTSKTVDLRRLR